MRFSIEKQKLDTMLDTLTALVDEAKFEFRDDMMFSQVVDPANVGYGEVEIGREAFETYDVNGEVFGINLNRLQSIIGLANNSEDMIFAELREQRGVLDISVNNINYTLALIDPDKIRDAKKPDLDSNAIFDINEKAVRKSLDAAEMVSDRVTFKVTDKKEFVVEASGDTDKVDISPDKEQGEIEYSDDFTAQNIESIFSLSYLADMSKAFPRNSMVTMEFDDDLPLEISFNPSDNISATYIIAPRIQKR